MSEEDRSAVPPEEAPPPSVEEVADARTPLGGEDEHGRQLDEDGEPINTAAPPPDGQADNEQDDEPRVG